MQHVYLLSDATGETVERVVKAALSQFPAIETRLHRWTRLRSQQDIMRALDDALENRGIIIYTLVDTELAQTVRSQAEYYGLETVDLITPLLYKLSDVFQMAPQKEPGLLYQLNAEYYKRVEAVNFTVQQDDGQEPRNLFKADIVLVGVSRTSKTPLSMYLAHRGYKVANIPLVKGIEPPKELDEIDQRKVVALAIEPKRLVELRAERLRHLRQSGRSSYADYEHVTEELEFCKRIYRQHPEWLVIDVTRKSVEESAADILKRIEQQH